MRVIFTFGDVTFLLYVNDRNVFTTLPSQIARFAKEINRFYPLTILAKRSMNV